MILDYGLTTFICMIAIVLIAGTIKITLGVGFALIAMPLLLLIMDAHEVIGFIAPLILLQDFIILAQMWRHVPWRNAVILAVSATVIAPFAAVLQTVLNPETLQMTISITIIVAGITLLSGVKFAIKNETRALVIAGGVSGALFPLAGIAGPPVALFLVNQRWEMSTMRAVLAAFLVVLELVTICIFAFSGVVNQESLLLDATMLPVLVIAVLISNLVLRKIDSKRYRTSVTTVIILSAMLGLVSLIVSSV